MQPAQRTHPSVCHIQAVNRPWQHKYLTPLVSNSSP
jgi:hypothetical protein